MLRALSLATIVIAGWTSLSLADETPADFSGQWTADPGSAATAAPSPAASPSASASPPLPRGDMGSGWGSPLTITQDARQLVVEYAPFSRYDLQPALRLVYALDGSETRNTVMMGHTTQVRLSRTAWEGRTLRITTLYPSVDPVSGKPFTTEVTHRLSLETPTALVVEVMRSGALGGRATTTRTVYKKN